MGAKTALLRNEEYDLPPTDIISDDPIILQQIDRGGSDIFIIVTDDLKLYRLALNKFPDTWVFRMSCVHYLQVNTWCKSMELAFDDELSSAFVQTYGEGLTVCSLVDKGSVESWLHRYEGTADKVFYQTIGIPWRKDIKRENLEKKPHHGSITKPPEKSMSELQIPRSLYDQETHRILLRTFRYARNRNVA
jgi:hypothetical protein